jgi:hypothetical protein
VQPDKAGDEEHERVRPPWPNRSAWHTDADGRKQYTLIFSEEEAYHYAREELLAAREREALLARAEATAPARTFEEWYAEYLRSPEWRKRADAAKERFGRCCALCGSSDSLEAHHRAYDRLGNEDPGDLTALCANCHRAYHLWKTGRLRPAE